MQRQPASQTRLIIRVCHSVIRPRAVFGVQQTARIISKLRRPRRVNHVRQPIQRAVLQRDVGAGRVIDEGEIAHVVVGVKRVAFGFAPAVGQPAVGVVLVTQDFDAGLIQFVGHAAVLIVIPGRHLVLAVRERDQIAGRVVGVLDDFVVGIGLARFPPRSVKHVPVCLVKLIDVIGQPTGRVGIPFDSTVQIGPR